MLSCVSAAYFAYILVLGAFGEWDAVLYFVHGPWLITGVLLSTSP